MNADKCFFASAFYSALDKLNVCNMVASSTIGSCLQDRLMEESINYDFLKECLKEFINEWPKQNGLIRIVVEEGFAVSPELFAVLSQLNIKFAILGCGTKNKTIFGAPVIDSLTADDILFNEIFIGTSIGGKYLSRLEQHREALYQKLRKLADEKSLVIFTAKKVYFNQLRLSKALREVGHMTLAIVFDTGMTHHQNGFFDDVIYTDLLSFLLALNKVDYGILLHSQGWLFRYHIPVIIDIYKQKNCRQVVEMMDSQSFYLPQSTVDKISRSMKLAWGENAMENHSVQLACEDYIIHHSDGVIFNGDDAYREPLVKFDSQQLRDKHLAFPALPVRDFFHVSTALNENKHKKLVFVGGVPPFSANRPYELFGDSQLLGLVNKLVNKGCYLDIYNNPLIAGENDYEKLYPEFIKLAAGNDRFNFFRGDVPQNINKIISKYDFGLMVYDFHGTYIGDLHFRHLIPTKLFNYLEAGLPVLVSDRWTAVCNIVKEYQIGIVIKQHEIDILPKIIELVDVAELKRNVITAREELQMHNNIHRLTDFYEQVMT